MLNSTLVRSLSCMAFHSSRVISLGPSFLTSSTSFSLESQRQQRKVNLKLPRPEVSFPTGVKAFTSAHAPPSSTTPTSSATTPSGGPVSRRPENSPPPSGLSSAGFSKRRSRGGLRSPITLSALPALPALILVTRLALLIWSPSHSPYT
ncbi:hypothetical protein EYF80_008312 [Liparis tanakae]|uniref:Uncharacterized protein n=1 Tax=Liparis tanakae TaxID=230148 RepID=A0A4Z2IU77_9TELE|nr:hypothetical protein EYF80_008312 [Liparis tanakae]